MERLNTTAQAHMKTMAVGKEFGFLFLQVVFLAKAVSDLTLPKIISPLFEVLVLNKP